MRDWHPEHPAHVKIAAALSILDAEAKRESSLLDSITTYIAEDRGLKILAETIRDRFGEPK